MGGNTNRQPGGLGGGGLGGNYASSGNSGDANTGGGAGGYGTDANNGSRAGGSGVVILRSLIVASSTSGSPQVITDGDYTVYRFTGDGSITY